MNTRYIPMNEDVQYDIPAMTILSDTIKSFYTDLAIRFFYLEGQSRLVVLITTEVLLGKVEDSPDGGEDSEHVPEESVVVDSEDLSGSLSSQAVVDQGHGRVGGQEGGQRDTSSGGLGHHVLLLGGADGDRLGAGSAGSGCGIQSDGSSERDQLTAVSRESDQNTATERR